MSIDTSIIILAFALLVSLFILYHLWFRVKGAIIESRNREKDDEIGQRLAKRYFWFLVDEYGFNYEKYTYLSKEMVVVFELGHKTPSIFINRIREPDFVRLNLEWILKFFHGTSPSDGRDYTTHSLEGNMAFISHIFRDNSRRLIEEFDDWWFPAHVFFYRTIEKKYEDEGQTENFLKSYKHYYEYLKSNGAV